MACHEVGSLDSELLPLAATEGWDLQPFRGARVRMYLALTAAQGCMKMASRKAQRGGEVRGQCAETAGARGAGGISEAVGDLPGKPARRPLQAASSWELAGGGEGGTHMMAN